jgi:multidrug efflux pump subunit AcrA (membrane-fusion protein)
MPALLLNPYVLLALLSALLGSHWYAYRSGAENAQNKAAAEALDARKAHDAAMASAAVTIAQLETRQSEIRADLEAEIRENPAYRCRHTPNGLRAVNQALTGPADRR